MAMISGITKPIQKQLPKASNAVGAGIVGIGAYRVARFLDGLIGNRIQAIGIQLPFVGSISVLDALMITAFKATMRKNTMVAAAFAGDRVFNLAVSPGSLIPGLSIGNNIQNQGSAPSGQSGPRGGGF